MYFLGECHLAGYRYEDAVEAYDRYIDSAREDGAFREAALVGKALCYEGLQDYDQAAAILEDVSTRIREDDPRYYDVLFQAATFYKEADERQKAIELFQRVSEAASVPLSDRARVWLNVLD